MEEATVTTTADEAAPAAGPGPDGLGAGVPAAPAAPPDAPAPAADGPDGDAGGEDDATFVDLDEFDEAGRNPARADLPGDHPAGAGTVAALWLSKPSLERLRESLGMRVVEEPEAATNADVVVISTRAPRARALPIVRAAREAGRVIGVVCHTGGEPTGLEIMRAGGAGVVAEGNEAALRRLLIEDDNPDENLVTTYEQRIGSVRGGDLTASSRDRVTGLPAASAFDARLSELSQAGSLARVGFVDVTNFSSTTTGLEAEGIDVLRRRLAVFFSDIAQRFGVELFVTSRSGFAFVGRDMTPRQAQEFGRELALVAEMFAPGGTLPLALAVGHAGPELSTDLPLLRELAERALEAAAKGEGSAVVNAEDLSSSLVSSTELDLALRMVSYLSDSDGYPGSHSSRVADYASEIARQLGFEGRDLIRVRLAGLLHDIGKVGLPPEAMQESEELTGPSLEAYRSHPERGARYARLTAGPEIAEAIRAHHESWDGQGFPRGLRGDEIPLTARVIAVANFYDVATTVPGPDGVPLTRKEALESLRELAGKRFDPTMVEAAEVALSR